MENEHSTINHSVFFLVCTLSALLLPSALRLWPFPLLVPILLYFAFVGSIPPLRRSFRPPPVGGRRLSSWLIAVVIAAVTSGILIGFQQSQQPDLQYLHDRLPIATLGWGATALVFPIANAALEEFVFRWILFEGFRARWGASTATAATSVLFGLVHVGGYPPGGFGAVLAAIYGLSLALLRLHSRGLLVPTVAHVLADATILAILSLWTVP